MTYLDWVESWRGVLKKVMQLATIQAIGSYEHYQSILIITDCYVHITYLQIEQIEAATCRHDRSL